MSKRDATFTSEEKYAQALKADIKAWLSSSRPPKTQSWLARKLQVSSQDVSSNLNPSRVMTEGFIRKISQTIPEWADAYIKYLEIKGGSSPTSELKAEAKRRKSKAQKIQSLRTAEEEVIKAIRALTETAIEVLDQNN